MHIFYDIADTVTAFTAGKGCHGTEPGVDAREVGVTFPNCLEKGISERRASADLPLYTPPLSGDFCRRAKCMAEGRRGAVGVCRGTLFIPRQTHSLNVCWAEGPGECPDTDAVITNVKGLCVAVKTADCIPVLLYDERQQLVAAVHAGWRGTVGRIVERTIHEMQSRGEDLHAIIGPGISLDSFEVGDEVYDAFREAGFPMERIAKRYPVLSPQPSTLSPQSTILNPQPTILNPQPTQLSTTLHSTPSTLNSEKWHLDLWAANRWLLEQAGVTRIHIEGTDTMTSADFYSARRESIKTGRNINGIMLCR